MVITGESRVLMEVLQVRCRRAGYFSILWEFFEGIPVFNMKKTTR
tara:strand:- start:337 stop:471 length:135 start_codon:yes stop_codon:yes gene_type:complete